jgi:flagellar hook-basal body complex protein FliE
MEAGQYAAELEWNTATAQTGQRGGAMQAGLNPMNAATPALSTLAGVGAAAVSPVSQAAAPTPFAGLLSDAVGQVNQLQDQAHAAVSGLLGGSGVDVHQAMIATQKASMAFELALAVRNKAVQAYQQVMGMQF